MLDPIGVRKKLVKFRGQAISEEEWLGFVQMTEESINEDPSWICVCQLPGTKPLAPETAKSNSRCIFQPSTFYWETIATAEACRDMVPIREAYLHKNGACICKDRAMDHSEHSIVLTANGFDRVHGCRSSMAKLADMMQKKPLTPPAVREIIVRLECAIRDCHFETMNIFPRPFNMWSVVEGIAWFTNDISFDLSSATDGEERAQIIALIGTMVLTVIDALISQELFTTEGTPIIRNLSLIMALLLKFGNAVDNDEYCPSNEAGWTYLALCLAEKHEVKIKELYGIDTLVKAIRKKGTELDARRSRQRRNWWLREQWGLMRSSTKIELEEYAANEGQPPCKRGTGIRRKWLLEDDYDPDGLRYWKRWNLQDEYKLYLKDSAKRKRGKQPKITTATRFTKEPARRMKILD